MLDGSIKTILVDDSHNVKEIIETICSRIGINNPDEFSLVVETGLNGASTMTEPNKTATLGRNKVRTGHCTTNCL